MHDDLKHLSFKQLWELARERLGRGFSRLRTRSQLLEALQRGAEGASQADAPSHQASTGTPRAPEAPRPSAPPAEPAAAVAGGGDVIRGGFFHGGGGGSRPPRRRAPELRAFARDPWTLFALWSVPPELRPAHAERPEAVHLQLRLLDQEGALLSREEVMLSASRYFAGLVPGASYRVELWWEGGGLLPEPLALPPRSVTLPPDRPAAPPAEVQRMRVPWDQPLGGQQAREAGGAPGGRTPAAVGGVRQGAAEEGRVPWPTVGTSSSTPQLSSSWAGGQGLSAASVSGAGLPSSATSPLGPSSWSLPRLAQVPSSWSLPRPGGPSSWALPRAAVGLPTSPSGATWSARPSPAPLPSSPAGAPWGWGGLPSSADVAAQGRGGAGQGVAWGWEALPTSPGGTSWSARPVTRPWEVSPATSPAPAGRAPAMPPVGAPAAGTAPGGATAEAGPIQRAGQAAAPAPAGPGRAPAAPAAPSPEGQAPVTSGFFAHGRSVPRWVRTRH